jgi:hypothetical protein
LKGTRLSIFIHFPTSNTSIIKRLKSRMMVTTSQLMSTLHRRTRRACYFTFQTMESAPKIGLISSSVATRWAFGYIQWIEKALGWVKVLGVLMTCGYITINGTLLTQSDSWKAFPKICPNFSSPRDMGACSLHGSCSIGLIFLAVPSSSIPYMSSRINLELSRLPRCGPRDFCFPKSSSNWGVISRNQRILSELLLKTTHFPTLIGI